MWDSYDTMQDFFGEDWLTIEWLYHKGYQVEVLSCRRDAPNNKYRIVWVGPHKRKVIGEFDTLQELAAITKLLMASETS